MTKQVIFLGQTPNDRTGDPLRVAFEKVNENFDELYARTGDDIQIPALAGNNGKYLTTNGTALSWGTINTTVDRVVNGDFQVVLDSSGNLTAPGNITAGANGGRFVQDASGGASSIRWINMPSNTSEIFARLYTDSGTDSGERARFGLNWLDQNRSGITLTAFDRTGTLVRRNWRFQGDGKLQLPVGGDIILDGNSVIGNRSRGPSSVSVVVIASDENANTITVGGDRTDLFGVGERVWSTASTDFFPQYFFLVTDVAYDAGLDQTVITLGDSIGSTVYTGSDLYSVINFNSFNEILPGDNIAFDFINNALVINATSGSSDRLVNGANEVVLGADGVLTLPGTGTITNPNSTGSPTGTIYTFSNDGTETPGITNDTAVYLENNSNSQAIQSGWIITFADATQQTVLVADVGMPPNASKRMLTFAEAVTKTGSQVWPLTVQSADYAVGSELYSLELSPNGTTAWTFRSDGTLTSPNGATQSSTGSINCQPGVDTVVFTSSQEGIQTIKLLLQVEGIVTGNDLDTQSCEMIVAKGFRGPTVAASVYGIVYTSVAPLATFTADWNIVTSRVEITCQPTSLTNNVNVKAFATEITTSD
jgi:hypothetical protein